MTTLNGITKKFTVFDDVGPVDCYLQIGLVGSDDWERFPHLCIGDICYLNLTVSKQGDELRVYGVLMDMARRVISCGGDVHDVAKVLRDNEFPPKGCTGEQHIPIAKSICDYIGRYLERRR